MARSLNTKEVDIYILYSIYYIYSMSSLMLMMFDSMLLYWLQVTGIERRCPFGGLRSVQEVLCWGQSASRPRFRGPESLDMPI